MDSLHDFDEQADLVLDVEQVTELEKRAEQAGIPLASPHGARGRGACRPRAVARTVRDRAHAPASCFCAAPATTAGTAGCARASLRRKDTRSRSSLPRSADDIKAQPARDAAIPAHKALLNAECTVLSADDERVPHVLAQADIAVDALLGTGFSGEGGNRRSGPPDRAAQRKPCDCRRRGRSERAFRPDRRSGLSLRTCQLYGHYALRGKTGDRPRRRSVRKDRRRAAWRGRARSYGVKRHPVRTHRIAR